MMSIAASAIAEAALADSASRLTRKPPPKRVTTARRDLVAAAEPR